MQEIQIVGTGSYVPERKVTNEELSTVIDTSDEWIRTRTGILERRISTGENTSDISCKAAIEAMDNAGIKPEDIDLIITATATPDCFTPATACIVQKKIGAVNALCFDISAACSGFIYGLNIASQFLKNGDKKTALIIGAETLSKILDWNDRSTCVLFGDGAGAAILKASNDEGIIAIHCGSDGRKNEVLKCQTVPVKVNNHNLASLLNSDKDETGDDCKRGFLSMEGKEVFKFAVNAMQETIEKLIEDANCTLEDIKYIIPHQANLRIIDFVARKLNIEKDKFYINLQNYGNTSAASIPIALNEMNKKGLLNKDDKILMVGFGGGLTWGGVIVNW